MKKEHLIKQILILSFLILVSLPVLAGNISSVGDKDVIYSGNRIIEIGGKPVNYSY